MHIVTPHGILSLSSGQFQDVHVNLVGPLPPSRGYSYLLTCIDRFIRWAEVIPIPCVNSETTAWALLNDWVAQFGAPAMVITDRGPQFESDLWRQILRLLGPYSTNRHSSVRRT